MLCKIDKYLRKIYIISGYLAALFLILVATFIITGIASRIFGFYIRGLAEYSGYSMAAASFLALAYTFGEKGHIRITLFLEKTKANTRKILEVWCLFITTFFSGFLSYYFLRMLFFSIKFGERSEGADEIYIWIPQVPVAVGSAIFFICVLHNFVLLIYKKNKY
jgi:TRAP-type C4-dicarboxylate transport system, small permease component